MEDRHRYSTSSESCGGRLSDVSKRRWVRYRYGSPQLPPLPVEERVHGARDLVNNPGRLIERASSLCDVAGIKRSRIYFAFRLPKVRHCDKNYLTMVVTIDMKNDDPSESAVESLMGLLKSNNSQHILIEIIDDRVVDGLASFPIPPSSPLLDDCQTVYDLVLKVIHENKEEWITLEMLLRGVHEDAARCVPTIVVTSPTAANDVWWDIILPNIRTAFDNLYAPLSIELLCGKSVYTASRDISPTFKEYDTQVRMGSSIGQQHSSESTGTLGGRIRLSNNKVFGLTTYRVTRKESFDTLLSGNPKLSWAPPLKPHIPQLKAGEHVFVCPSDQDNALFIEGRGTQIEHAVDRLKFNSNPTLEHQLEQRKNERNTAKNFDRKFGILYASSGLRTTSCEKFSTDPNNGQSVTPTNKAINRFLLDWSLVQILPGRDMQNMLPVSDSLSRKEGVELWEHEICQTWSMLNNPFANINRDELVVGKFGRTTRCTYGLINRAPVIINPEVNNGEFRFMPEAYGMTVKDSAACFQMTAAKALVLKPGDSGSIVIHVESSNWLGLVFGETASGSALFTPIDIVLRDIEEVTKLKIVEPVFSPGSWKK